MNIVASLLLNETRAHLDELTYCLNESFTNVFFLNQEGKRILNEAIYTFTESATSLEVTFQQFKNNNLKLDKIEDIQSLKEFINIRESALKEIRIPVNSFSNKLSFFPLNLIFFQIRTLLKRLQYSLNKFESISVSLRNYLDDVEIDLETSAIYKKQEVSNEEEYCIKTQLTPEEYTRIQSENFTQVSLEDLKSGNIS